MTQESELANSPQERDNHSTHTTVCRCRDTRCVIETLDPERNNAQPLGITPLEDHRLNQLNQTAETQPSIERHIQEPQLKALRNAAGRLGSNKALQATR